MTKFKGDPLMEGVVERKKEEEKLLHALRPLINSIDDLKKEIFWLKSDRDVLMSVLRRLDALEHPDLSPSLKAFNELRKRLGGD